VRTIASSSWPIVDHCMARNETLRPDWNASRLEISINAWMRVFGSLSAHPRMRAINFAVNCAIQTPHLRSCIRDSGGRAWSFAPY
jgi:hypothetical protein